MLMGRKTYVLHSDEDTAVVITRLGVIDICNGFLEMVASNGHL